MIVKTDTNTNFTVMQGKTDIHTREDVAHLITRFYEKVRADELLSPVFAHVDWEHHTPVIIEFWNSILLGSDTYRGNPFQKHIALPIQPIHFDRWLALFSSTVNEFFEGDKAAEAKQRANSIAAIFQHKLGLI